MTILEKPKGRVRHALLIDDDELSQFINRAMIAQAGLVDTCISHYNGATALEMLIQEQNNGLSFPDLILLDLNMPIMDGFEFLERLNERKELSFLLKRIIVLSSSNCASDVAKIRKLGVHGYLPKPLVSKALSLILENMDTIERTL